jgi:predicted DNA-binding transcriptional regulator YafY
MKDVVTRLFAMVDFLQSRGPTTVPELAQHLGVSERTVQRDLVRLSSLEVTVKGTPGRAGGVTLVPGSLLSPLRFTDDELLALALGAKLVARLGDTTLETASKRAAKRLEQILTERTKTQLSALDHALALKAPSQANFSKVESRTLLELAEAVHEQQTLELRYAAANRKESLRNVDPYGLARLYGRWYLAGYCHLRLYVRTFRVDRIRSFGITDRKFSKPDHFDAYGETLRSLNQAPISHAVFCKVRLSMTLNEASQLLPSVDGLLEPDPNGVLLTAHVPVKYLNNLAVNLLGLAYKMEILESPELKLAFAKVAANAATLSAP